MRNELYARNPKTVRYDTKTISFLSPKIYALIQQNINLKRDQQMETQLPMSFMQNIFETCWFYIAQYKSSLHSVLFI